MNIGDFETRETRLNDFLDSVSIIGVDEETARIIGRERGRLRRAGAIIGDMDLLIAATALQYDPALPTNNRQHFERIEGLRIESLPAESRRNSKSDAL